MSLWNTANVVSPAVQTASYTMPSTNDVAPFLITAAATATLPSSSGQYGGNVYNQSNRTGGQGRVFVKNSALSTANVTVAAASGDAIFGNTVCAPGQILKFESDGAGIWYGSVYGTTSGGSTIATNVIPVTSANLLAIRTTPLAIVATPASGKCNILDNISFKMVTTATQYTSGGALEFRYTGTSGTKVTADIAAAVVTTTAGTSFTNVRGIEASLTGTVDAPIVMTAASADFATGTGTGLLVVQYHII